MKIKTQTPTRAYFALGVLGGNLPSNIAGLWRTAFEFGASYVFTVKAHLPKTATDEITARKYGLVFNHPSLDDFLSHLPNDCTLVLVTHDSHASSRDWIQFKHPERAIYLLVNDGMVKELKAANLGVRELALSGIFTNLTMAGSLVLSAREGQYPASKAISA